MLSMVESTRSDGQTGLECTVELKQYRLSANLVATVSDLQGEKIQSRHVEETLLSAGTARYAVNTLEQDRYLSVRSAGRMLGSGSTRSKYGRLRSRRPPRAVRIDYQWTPIETPN